MINITILVLPGTFPSSVFGPMEIFKMAGVGWNMLVGAKVEPLFDVKVLSLDGKTVPVYGGIQIKPEDSVRKFNRCDLLVIPTLGITAEEVLSNGAKAIPWIKSQYDAGAKIASICSGSFLLAEAGLLDQRIATTHWGFAESFRKLYPHVDLRPQRMVTEDNNVFCGGGVNAWVELSLYLVQIFAGRDVALQVSKALLLEVKNSYQSAFAIFSFQKEHGDKKVLDTQNWLERNITSEVSIDSLAKLYGMSPRNFKRRFRLATGDTPLSYLHRLRVNEAKSLLETSKSNIQLIAEKVGYENTQFFRRIFKRYTGMTPSAYKEKARHISISYLSDEYR